MTKLSVLPAILAAAIATGPGLVHEFVTGPATLGNPGADDPSVGYNSVTLDQKLDSPRPEAAFAPGGSGVPMRPWEQQWYQLNQRPGVGN